jgi:hypothetical protein
VRSLLPQDDADGCVKDASGEKVTLPRGSSDAMLAPYHVDRSKLFVLKRMADIAEVAAKRIASAIEFTRFPVSSSSVKNENEEDDTLEEEDTLLWAADLIGQLGDPHYLRKANALYYEFEETGVNLQARLCQSCRCRRPLFAVLLE